MQTNSKISIITVVYNGEKYLEDSIKSVINQTYSNIEYIIIDGGSTDGTLDIIKRYEDKIDYWVSEKDKGIYDAMNKGIKVSNGIFINFLNAGDKFVSNDVVESIANVAQKDIKLIYGNTLFYNKIKNTIKKQISMEFTLRNITKYTTRVVCHQSMFINKNNFVSYNLQYKLKGELQLYFELALQKEDYVKLDKEIAVFLEDGAGTQRFYENMKERVKVIYRYGKFIAIIKSLPFLFRNYLTYLRKRILKW
jgi:glycosyltransferase involved in cell wall biosynthesis